MGAQGHQACAAAQPPAGEAHTATSLSPSLPALLATWGCAAAAGSTVPDLFAGYKTLPQGERLPGKSLFFVRVNPKGISEKTLESDVAVGEIQGSALDTFKALLADLFLPLLQEQSSWGKMPPQHTKDFLTGMWKQRVSLWEGCIQVDVCTTSAAGTSRCNSLQLH